MDKVLIIGAGPAGMACALALARRGFAVGIIDRRLGRPPVAKATGGNLRSCRWLADQGIDLREEAIPMRHFVFHDDEKLVANVRLPLLSGEAPAYLFPQAELERRMESALLTQGIGIQYGMTLTAIEAGDKCAVALQTADDSTMTKEVDWVVGADGGHSTLRQMLDIPFVGRDYPEIWSVAEVDTAAWDDSAQARLHLQRDGTGLFLSQPSPVGGQGLNLSIRDGVTLGNGLGQAAPDDIARQLATQARRTLMFTDFDYRMLSTRSRLIRHARNAYWQTAARHPWIAHWFVQLIAGR
jgi:2-polyprenyl-6-methoxyphenol hydroxylase-like FAD-dependent oxidoreductase